MSNGDDDAREPWKFVSEVLAQQRPLSAPAQYNLSHIDSGVDDVTSTSEYLAYYRQNHHLNPRLPPPRTYEYNFMLEQRRHLRADEGTIDNQPELSPGALLSPVAQAFPYPGNFGSSSSSFDASTSAVDEIQHVLSGAHIEDSGGGIMNHFQNPLTMGLPFTSRSIGQEGLLEPPRTSATHYQTSNRLLSIPKVAIDTSAVPHTARLSYNDRKAFSVPPVPASYAADPVAHVFPLGQDQQIEYQSKHSRYPSSTVTNANAAKSHDHFSTNTCLPSTGAISSGNAAIVACDQYGSRRLQEVLCDGSLAECDTIFRELEPNAVRLMQDRFGNYVMQRVFEKGLRRHKARLAELFSTHVLQLSMHPYGCRVIQKALEHSSRETRVSLASELQGHVRECVLNDHGNHVVQKLVACLNGPDVDFVINEIAPCSDEMSKHAFGCRVIQRIIEYCHRSQVARILDKILTNVKELICDQFGNFVIQHILENGDSDPKQRVLQSLHGELILLSQHKFASNVVERSFLVASSTENEQFIEELLLGSIPTLLNCKYGNYVLQKALETAAGPQRQKLVDSCKIYLADDGIYRFAYGKHVLSRIQSLDGCSLATNYSSSVSVDPKSVHTTRGRRGKKKLGRSRPDYLSHLS